MRKSWQILVAGGAITALVHCQRAGGDVRPPVPHDAAAAPPAPAPVDAAFVDANDSAVAPVASVPPVDPDDGLIKLIPVGPADAPVRAICYVDAACGGKGLDRSAFVEHEATGQSCEEARAADAACPALVGNTPILEEKSFSTLCALGGGFLGFLGAHWREEGGVGGGAPRAVAKASLRRLVARGVPCLNQPPGSRPSYRVWCERYRADGTLYRRDYYARLIGNDGEHEWVEKLDEKGKITYAGTLCDAGHH